MSTLQAVNEANDNLLPEFKIVTPWHREDELEGFLKAWGIGDGEDMPDFLILQHDKDKEGCAITKNRGIARAMVQAETNDPVIIVLDGDCYPSAEAPTLESLAVQHIAALDPQPVVMFEAVTHPPSRGTPYTEEGLTMMMPVAASMGFWEGVPDHCAVRQLATRCAPMKFRRDAMHGRYFPLCGMNLAFRPSVWTPWSDFIHVDRFDDIWQGWLWQREAYRRGFCFNLNAPTVIHARMSDVWANLRTEAMYLECNETLWRKIAEHDSNDYERLRALLPV